ncbi:MAG: ribbon-helix-helix domain-containing protein [Candidatus Bathyarchaeia archaeon]
MIHPYQKQYLGIIETKRSNATEQATALNTNTLKFTLSPLNHECNMPENEENTQDDYTTVRLPKELIDEIDQIIKRGIRGYKSRSEFIKEAIRKRFEDLQTAQPMPKLPPLEHFNVDEEGVRILDRTLATKTSGGRIIDVYFKPDSVFCDYCQSSNCRHTKFAQELPAVQEILGKKGWKIA